MGRRAKLTIVSAKGKSKVPIQLFLAARFEKLVSPWVSSFLVRSSCAADGGVNQDTPDMPKIEGPPKAYRQTPCGGG